MTTGRQNNERASAADNIDTILKLEKQDEQELALSHRLIHAIGAFFGTIWFITVQCAIVAVWVVANTLPALHAWAIDPFPYPLIASILSLQAVLLTSCVLIRQNAMDRMAERRDHLELQINLLAEREATHALAMLRRISDRLGLPTDPGEETEELAKKTPVDKIARELRDRESERGANR